MSNVALFNPSQAPAFAKARGELSAMAKALAGGGGGGKRVSIKGGVFRLVNNGKEVAAMLQGGEVVIPKEIVRDLKNGAVSNSSVYNNTPNITVNVAGTNASPQDIANAVSQAMQRRQDMVRTRTVIG